MAKSIDDLVQEALKRNNEHFMKIQELVVLVATDNAPKDVLLQSLKEIQDHGMTITQPLVGGE